MTWAPLIDADWEQTTHFWDDATVRGLQFSDIDLLVAAVAAWLGGMIVSGDDDFDALPPPARTDAAGSRQDPKGFQKP